MKKDQYFFYVDPIDQIPEAGRARWADKSQHEAIMSEALEAAKANAAYLAP